MIGSRRPNSSEPGSGRSPRVRAGAVGLALILLVGIVAGCGSGRSSSGRSGTTAGLEEALPPAKGDIGQLSWALPTGEPDSIDPIKAFNLNSGLISNNTCDTLLRLNPDFSVSPNLATSEEPNPTTLVYTIRKGVRFWDGKPLTSEDVAYSLERAAGPESFVGFLFEKVRSIRATGPYQVTVKLREPDALLNNEMTGPTGAVVEKAYVEKEGKNFGTPEGGVMCSGPLEFKKWNPGADIELVRNEGYWNPKWRSHAAKVTLKFTSDSASLAQGLDSGELDGAYEIPPAILPNLQSSSSGAVHYGPSAQFLALSPTEPGGPLKDLTLRKALFKSINREGIAQTLYQGEATPDYTLIPSGSWNQQTSSLWEGAAKKYEMTNAFDIEAAKKLVEGSGYRGEPIVLGTLVGDETQAAVAQLIQDSARQAGMNVQIKPLQSTQYTTAAYDASARKGLDLILQTTYFGYPDPIELLPFFLTPNPSNYTDYKNSEVTELLHRARSTLNVKTRTQILLKAQSIYEPSYPVQSLVSMPEIMFLNDELSGAVTSFAYLSEPSLALIGSAGK